MAVEVIPGRLAATPPAMPPLRLPRREIPPPESEQLSGPYGPVFAGFGPSPKRPLLHRIGPAGIGLAGGVLAIGFSICRGSLGL